MSQRIVLNEARIYKIVSAAEDRIIDFRIDALRNEAIRRDDNERVHDNNLKVLQSHIVDSIYKTISEITGETYEIPARKP